MAPVPSTKRIRQALQRKVQETREQMLSCIADVRAHSVKVKEAASLASEEAAKLERAVSNCADRYQKAQQAWNSFLMNQVKQQ